MNVIEAVNEIDDGGFSGSGGPYESDFLPGFGVEADAVENGFLRGVAKNHVMEAHIPPQQSQRMIPRILPGPASGFADAFFYGTLGSLLCRSENHMALIFLRLFLHHAEDPLRPGHGGQHKVGLLSKLIDGHSRLADKDQIAGQAAYIRQAVDGHDPADDGYQGIINIGNTHHHGNHGAGEAHCFDAGLPQLFVSVPEGFQIGGFVVEDLHHFLTGDHLLHVAVQLSQMFLLLVKIVFALFGTVADVQEHGRVPQNHQKGQPPVQEEQQNQGPHYLDKTLDNHGEAVVEGVRDGVHIVGEAAHNVSVGVGVKIFQRQAFHGAEQIRRIS